MTELWYVTATLIGVVLAVFLALNLHYSAALGARPRRAERVAGDIEVARQVATLAALMALMAAVGLGLQPPLKSSVHTQLGIQFGVGFAWAMYVSSLLDWYYVRPRRDGVVVEPPCRTSTAEHWQFVTRIWYGHRSVTPFVCLLAAIASLGFLTLALIDPSSKNRELAVVGTFFVAAGVAERILSLGYASLRDVGYVFTKCVTNPPDHALGQRLVGPDEEVGAFIRDVSVESVATVPLNPDQTPISPHTVINRPVGEVTGVTGLKREAFAGCRANCVLVNRQCQWIPEPERVERRRVRITIGRDINAATGVRVDGHVDLPDPPSA